MCFLFTMSDIGGNKPKLEPYLTFVPIISKDKPFETSKNKRNRFSSEPPNPGGIDVEC